MTDTAPEAPENSAPAEPTAAETTAEEQASTEPEAGRPREIGGRGGLDPARYGDWEKNGRCIDF